MEFHFYTEMGKFSLCSNIWYFLPCSKLSFHRVSSHNNSCFQSSIVTKLSGEFQCLQCQFSCWRQGLVLLLRVFSSFSNNGIKMLVVLLLRFPEFEFSLLSKFHSQISLMQSNTGIQCCFSFDALVIVDRLVTE